MGDYKDTMTSRHPVDEVLPPARLGLLGLQHVLAMYTGCVTVPLVFGAAAGLDTHTIGLLVNADLLVAGLITLLQALGIGNILGIRLPVVAGATFTAVTPMILIAGQCGVQAVYGSMLAELSALPLTCTGRGRTTRFRRCRASTPRSRCPAVSRW